MNNKIIIGFFFLTITLPLILHPFNIKSDFNQENRSMTQLPKKPINYNEAKKFFGEFDNYLNDNIPLRSIMISLFNTMYYQIGVSPAKNMIIGKNGWLFNNMNSSVNQYLGRKILSNKQIEKRCKVLTKNFNYFKSKNTPFYFFVAPDKHTIYNEFLPDYLNYSNNHLQNYDRIYYYLNRNTSLKPIDVRSKLLAEKVKRHDLYYKSDTHWNSVGSFNAYLEVISRINSDLEKQKQVYKLTWKDAKVEYFKKGDGGLHKMLASLFQYEEEAPVVRLKENRITKSELNGPRGPHTAKETRVFSTSTSNGPTLLLIRDSFSSAMIPFYAHSFSKIITVHHEQGNWDTNILKKHKPDIVIFEMVERFLGIDFKSTKF